MKTTNVMIVGVGGQGSLLASKLLGRLLMERLFALGRSFGCTDVQLTCDPHNAPGMAFYGSLGMGVKTVQYQMKLSYQSCEPSKKACSPPWTPCALPAET